MQELLDEQRRRDVTTRSNGRATKALLIDMTSELLRGADGGNVNLELVLQVSGVSTGSLYHHFGNFENLLWAARAKLLAEDLSQDNKLFRGHLLQCQSSEEVRALIEATISGMFEDSSVKRRARRLSVIEGSSHHHVARGYLQELHSVGNEYLSETLELATSSGIIRLEAPSNFVASVSQVMLFGASFLDVLDEPREVQELWKLVSVESLCRLLGIMS